MRPPAKDALGQTRYLHMGPANLTRAAIGRSDTIRAAVKSEPIQRIINAQRAARFMRPIPAFLVGEMGHRRGTYRIRRTGRRVVLRHGSRDIEIANEIFSPLRLSYEPPLEVTRTLGDRPLTVVDLGGNIGLFGVFALARWPIVSIVSFEPDPTNARLLQQAIKANDATDVWRLEQCAVSNTVGEASFMMGRFADGYVTGGDGGDRVNVADYFETPQAELLKMDIEGSEWPILADPRLSAQGSPRVIVLEWHAAMCPADDPHAHARACLTRASYTVVADRPSHTGRNGVMWAIRDDS